LDDLVNLSVNKLSNNVDIEELTENNNNKDDVDKKIKNKEEKIKKENKKIEENKENKIEEKINQKYEKVEEEENSNRKDLVKSIPISSDENISLEFEDIIPLSNNDDMTEVDISLDTDDEAIRLKNKNQIYQEIYQKAKDKVKELKNATIVAYMELKNIKSMYMLDDIYDSDSDIEELDEMDLEI